MGILTSYWEHRAAFLGEGIRFWLVHKYWHI